MPPSLRAEVPAAASSVESETPAELFARLFGSDQRPVVLYDGVCNMCNRAVDVALQNDPQGERLRFAALQSGVGRGLLAFCGRDPDDLSTMVVVQPDGRCLVKSDAALFVGGELPESPVLRGASNVASRLLPKAVRDAAYGALAANRYRVLGQRQELRTGEAGRGDRFVADTAAAGA